MNITPLHDMSELVDDTPKEPTSSPAPSPQPAPAAPVATVQQVGAAPVMATGPTNVRFPAANSQFVITEDPITPEPDQFSLGGGWLWTVAKIALLGVTAWVINGWLLTQVVGWLCPEYSLALLFAASKCFALELVRYAWLTQVLVAAVLVALYLRARGQKKWTVAAVAGAAVAGIAYGIDRVTSAVLFMIALNIKIDISSMSLSSYKAMAYTVYFCVFCICMWLALLAWWFVMSRQFAKRLWVMVIIGAVFIGAAWGLSWSALKYVEYSATSKYSSYLK